MIAGGSRHDFAEKNGGDDGGADMAEIEDIFCYRNRNEI